VPPSPAPSADTRDTGVTLATHSGATLLLLSLDPGAPGDNVLSVDVRNTAGGFVIGAVRVDGTLDGVALPPTSFAPTIRSASLAIPHAGRAELRVSVLDGKSEGASGTFSLDLPAESPATPTLSSIESAMDGLHTLRERETLTAGGPELLYTFEYQAPDRVRYTTVSPGGIQETRLIGRDRYDRPVGGQWTKTDIGFPSRVPSVDYVRGSSRVRLVRRSTVGGVELLDIAFVHGDYYYRIQVGAADDLVRSYTMMGRGHYMTATYSDYDARLAISAP
jgi:hypothetical protein